MWPASPQIEARGKQAKSPRLCQVRKLGNRATRLV
jgi:hypothetical protein